MVYSVSIPSSSGQVFQAGMVSISRHSSLWSQSLLHQVKSSKRDVEDAIREEIKRSQSLLHQVKSSKSNVQNPELMVSSVSIPSSSGQVFQAGILRSIYVVPPLLSQSLLHQVKSSKRRSGTWCFRCRTRSSQSLLHQVKSSKYDYYADSYSTNDLSQSLLHQVKSSKVRQSIVPRNCCDDGLNPFFIRSSLPRGPPAPTCLPDPRSQSLLHQVKSSKGTLIFSLCIKLLRMCFL